MARRPTSLADRRLAQRQGQIVNASIIGATSAAAAQSEALAAAEQGIGGNIGTISEQLEQVEQRLQALEQQ